MASVFKRGGKKNRGGSYYYAYFDHKGDRITLSARTTDKASAERIAAKAESVSNREDPRSKARPGTGAALARSGSGTAASGTAALREGQSERSESFPQRPGGGFT